MYYVASLYVCVHECECVWLCGFFVSTGELKHNCVGTNLYMKRR